MRLHRAVGRRDPGDCLEPGVAQGLRRPRGAGRNTLKQNPFSGHLFVFRGKRGNLVKILYWDGQRFCLFAKRLETRWKKSPDGQHLPGSLLSDIGNSFGLYRPTCGSVCVAARAKVRPWYPSDGKIPPKSQPKSVAGEDGTPWQVKPKHWTAEEPR